MGIETITSKIIKEAEDERDQILAEAAEESDAILAEAKEKADKLVKSQEAKGLEEKEKIISRRKSVADIECRKITLQKKQELISRCFDETVDAIINMNEEEYLKLLVSMCKNTGLKEGSLIFNEKERTSIGAKVVAALSEEIEGSCFTLSDEVRNVRGGFMLQSGKVSINNTIEALVEENRDGLSNEVAAMLFSR